jgi:serine/threonine protein kinase
MPRDDQTAEHFPGLGQPTESFAHTAPPDHAPIEPAAERGASGPLPEVPGFEILGELGRGGMGVVYRARQQGLNRTVALKMVLAGGHATADQLVRFLAEAEIAARLQHQGIAQIFDTGRAGGLPYFAMECVDGGSLADKLRDGPLPRPTPPGWPSDWPRRWPTPTPPGSFTAT